MAITCYAGNNDKNKCVIDAFIEKGAQNCLSFTGVATTNTSLNNFVDEFLRIRFACYDSNRSLLLDFNDAVKNHTYTNVYGSFSMIRLDYKENGSRKCILPTTGGNQNINISQIHYIN